jgi:hypothetical protein
MWGSKRRYQNLTQVLSMGFFLSFHSTIAMRIFYDGLGFFHGPNFVSIPPNRGGRWKSWRGQENDKFHKREQQIA